ncbi:glycosyltransferase [Pseudoalteromonas sp. 1181_04]|uniref:glycosyltransferase n=1 Tax=Pseudoalteromonas sp. 1181_04 TaxID=2604450 RepID=UPI004063F5E8
MIDNKLVAPESEIEIMSHWKHIDKVYVSCICITFNHELFIEDTLNAMLAQKSDYKFEIIIHDDASTDETQTIIQRYREKYPSIIRLILQKENQYSKGRKPLALILPMCQGDFIAYCEGDDYWVDDKKITLQARYLLDHKEVFITSHDAKIVDDNGNLIKDSKLPYIKKRDFSAEELILGKAWLLTLNWMFRRFDISDIPEWEKVKNGDTFITSIFGLYGGSHHHVDILPSAYRVHSEGVWSMLSENDKKDNIINTFFWIYRYYNRIGAVRYADYYWCRYIRSLFFKLSYFDILKEVLVKVTRFPRLLLKKI